MRRKLTRAWILAVAGGAAVHAATFKSTSKAPEAGTIGLAGKKVDALVITKDEGLPVAVEDGLVRQLVAPGVKGLAAYRVIPREEARDEDKAKAWF